MFENYNYYFNQAITKKSNLELLLSQHEQTKRDKETASQELKDLISKEASYEKAVDLMKKIIEGMSQAQINHLESWKDKTSEELGIKRREIEKIEMQVAELRMRENSSKTKLMKAKSKLDVLNDYKDSK